MRKKLLIVVTLTIVSAGIIRGQKPKSENYNVKNNKLAQIHLENGIMYYNMGLIDKAEEEFKLALNFNPKLPDAHYYLGNIYLITFRTLDAFGHFKQAIKIDPDHEGAHFQLGVILFQFFKQYDDAEKEFREVIRINPYHYKAHYYLGSILFIKGRYEEAQRELLKAKYLAP